MQRKKIKKLFIFTPEEWREIEDFRFLNRIDKQSEAVKKLIKLGLQCREKEFNKALEKVFTKCDKVLRNLAKR